MYTVNWHCTDGSMHDRIVSNMRAAWEIWHIKVADRDVCEVVILDKDRFRVAKWMLLDGCKVNLDIVKEKNHDNL